MPKAKTTGLRRPLFGETPPPKTVAKERKEQGRESQVTRLFIALMRCCDLRTWQRALDLSACYGRLLKFDPNSRSVFAVEREEISWTAALLLGGFHRKHVFVGRRLPVSHHFDRDVRAFLEKLKWRWHFRNETSSALPKTMRLTPPSYGGLIPPELNAWCARFASSMRQAFRRKQLELRNPALRPQTTQRSWMSDGNGYKLRT